MNWQFLVQENNKSAMQLSAVLLVLSLAAACTALPRHFSQYFIREKSDEGDSSQLLPAWLTSGIAAVRDSKSLPDSPSAEEDSDFFSRIRSPGEKLGPLLIHRGEPMVHVTRTSSTSESDVDLHRFRHKRGASCEALPEGLPELVKELNPFLEPDQFVGLEPEQSAPGVLPEQPEMCENGNPLESSCCAVKWWQQGRHTLKNLRATCPWRIEEKDYGPSMFPR